MILSIGGALAHQLEHRFFHLSWSQMGGVQIFGVRSLRQRSFRPAAIPHVTSFQVAGYIFHHRAQLRGWKFVYRPDVVSPAELPEDVVMHTRSKYIEAFERLTTIPFPAYRENPSVVLG